MIYRVLPLCVLLSACAALLGLMHHHPERAALRADLWATPPLAVHALPALVFVIGAAISAGVLWSWRRRVNTLPLLAALEGAQRLRRNLLLFVCVICCAGGYLRGASRAQATLPLTEAVDEVQIIADVVVGCRPARPPCAAVIEVRAARDEVGQWRPASGRYYLSIEESLWVPLRGEMLRARVALSPFSPPLHRFAFDAQRWGDEKRLRGFARLNAEAIRLPTRRRLAYAIDHFRASSEEAILARDDGDAGRVLVAMLTGSRTGLDSEVRERFAAAGIAHVLAVSGLHFALLVGSVWWLLERLFRRALRRTGRRSAGQLSALCTLPLAALYVTFTGAPASAVRAGLMVGTLLLTRVADRPSSSLHALSAAFFLMVMSDPSALLSRGFQLSMSATAALVAFSLLQRKARQRFSAPARGRGESRWQQATMVARSWLVASLQVSTVTAAATAPVIVWMTGMFPLLSHLGNILIVPLLALLALPLATLGAFGAALAGGGFVEGAFVDCALAITRFSLWLSEAGESWLSLSVVPGRPAELGLLGWILLAALMPWFCALTPGRRELRRWVVALSLTGLALTLVAADRQLRRPAHGELEVHAIPVGQGDATLVLAGPRDTLLVDAGGRGFGDIEVGRRYVLPYLRGLGIRRIDFVAVSHGDADHARGVLEIFDAIAPALVWLPGAAEQREGGQQDGARHELIAAIEARAREGGAQVYYPGAPGAQTELGGLLVRALPVAPHLGGNDGSMVLRLDHGEVSALFPGDVETAGEEALLGHPLARNVDYLKVAHHGSATSSMPRLVAQLAPQVAVIHLGHANRYRMPDAAVVLRLGRNAEVFRTDQGFAPIHRSDGHRLVHVSAPY